MQALERFLEDIEVTRPDHLPVVAAFCHRVGLVETINRVVPTNMDVDVGTIVQAMVIDTLSGRSPLYRLVEFFKHQDSELLVGRQIPCSAFNDTTVGRAMDAIFDEGAQKLFSEVAFQACCRFPLNAGHVHFDTTSVSLWGDYDPCRADSQELNITYGYSKDKRPDLKQFLIKMLCVERNIPILGGCEDGNGSDKTINNTLLSQISKHMARHGLSPGAFLYVADSAMVTEANLEAVGRNAFVTRLPFSYNETCRVVTESVAKRRWEPIGSLNDTPSTTKRPPAQYAVTENTVTLYGQQYRAVVVHSSAHDKRRLKRIEREISQSETTLRKLLVEETKHDYSYLADAEAAAERLRQAGTQLHRIQSSVTKKTRYARGRPPKNSPRKVASVHYVLDAWVTEKIERIKRKREEAGCFVLLTNVPVQGHRAKTGADLLRAYKDQYGIERNYAFLKDPLIVNDTFLKKPERIEVLGAILLIALLIWNLIEHVLRKYVAEKNADIPGWDNKMTRRPTAFMMSTKFLGLQTVRSATACRLAKPLSPVQKIYLKVLGLVEQNLTMPSSASLYP